MLRDYRNIIPTIITIIFISLIFCTVCFAGNSAFNGGSTTLEKIPVTGEFSYKYCLNACGVNNGHYIEFANVMIENECLSDPNCVGCLDMCAEELKENNSELYKSILDHTLRIDF